MEQPVIFYDFVLKKMIRQGILHSTDRILIVAAGALDRDAFYMNGFNDVHITNIDKDRGVLNYDPYKWEYQDAENLSYKNDEFDWTFVHAGLHHLASPHRGLCEMLRVSRKGIGVFEARDSLLNKIATKFGLVPSYEMEPCVLSQGKSGGFRNTNVPNYIYRWTEREVEKIVNSYLPQYIHEFYYYYELRIPNERFTMSPSYTKRTIGYIAGIFAPVFKVFFPKQGNHFAFIVTKKGNLQPWLMQKGESVFFDMNYIKGRFSPEKYSTK